MMKISEEILFSKCENYMGMDTLTDELLENSKKHTVMYSGGHDCTTILLGLCELKERGKLKGDIQIVHCTGLCAESKDRAEEIAIRKILKFIKKRFKIDIQVIKISIRMSYNLSEVPFHVGYILQYIYLVNAYHLFDDNACVYIGSIGDDPSQIKIPYIKNILDNLGKIRSNKINFITPIWNKDKKSIVEKLMYYYPEVMKMLVTCEFPKRLKNNHIKPCETCNKCMEIKRALSSVLNDDNLKETKISNLLAITEKKVKGRIKAEEDRCEEIKLDK